ncbi:hypothetical protein BMW26_07850 [Microbacterium sp. 1.5R]|uniref:hypothetical protein n=1 Tax=Microbacterium sp. 1.5R TaxID=1916917 RepID=UPI00090BA085|nr:hypothetical protein [Microbacterium sp. 1.5R]APH44879.1 hypothetical protein BMW26_07850 [Microbacterium sp. 1.5R]
MTDQTQADVSAEFSLVASELDTQEAGLFERVENTRNIRGLLLPFGELSRKNASGNEAIEFSAESIKLPRDHSVITLNVEHDRFNPIGRAVSLQVTERGVEAEFAIADTDEGDAYLANPVRKLSAEVAGIVRNAADKTKAAFARLTGAAVVKEGAFASAGLFSLAEGEDVPDPDVDPDGYNAFLDEVQAHLAAAQELINNQLSEADAPEPTPTATPAEDNTDERKEFTVSDTNEAGAVPATLLASSPAAKDVDLNAVYSAMSQIKSSTSTQTADQESFLAALADITTPAHVTSGAIPPTFAGKLWQGKRYQQRYISLANHIQGGIALGGRKGWKIDQGTALVAEVTNQAQKVELPTGSASTSTYTSTLRKFGFAADVALEWQYLEGGADILAAFWEGVVDSGAKQLDEAALKDLFTVASRGSGAALSRLVAPGTYPAEYPAAMGQLIQGIDLVSDNGDDASFAIVNPVAWNQLLFTPKDKVPEFVEFAVGVGTGEASTGKVRVVKADQSYFTGTVATAPQMIVGAKNAVEFREVHADINALEVAKFGVDRALVAFLETFVVRPESLALIGTKP